MERADLLAEMERARDDFRGLVETATAAELRASTDGTKWNNEQLLFHMLFGYLLVRNLRPLVRGFSRLPDSASRRFAAVLDAGTRPFHVVNYVGSLGGARVLGRRRMIRLMDRVIGSLQSAVQRETGEARAGHALPRRLGPLLHRLHDVLGRVPLPDPALRPPSSAATLARARET